MAELNKLHMKPSLEIVKFSEPKILTYLGFAILTFVILIFSMFYISVRIDSRLGIIQQSIDTRLEEMSGNVNNKLQELKPAAINAATTIATSEGKDK